MCKLDTVIRTTEQGYSPTNVIKRGKSIEQIEYMTNILFALAKRLQKPLDKTLESLEERDLFSILDKAYQNRNKKSSSAVLKELKDNILAI